MTGPQIDGPAPHGPALLDALSGWLPAQRWFPRSDPAAWRVVGSEELPTAHPSARAGVHLLQVDDSGSLVQVPLTAYPAEQVAGDTDGSDSARSPAALGTVRAADGTVWTLHDGCTDQVFLEAWLAAAERAPGAGEVGATGARLMSGEQSNTSVVLPDGTVPAILKVFRRVAGLNPDVEVPLALSGTGWAGVPPVLGWLTGRWPLAPGGGCHLGVLTTLVDDAEDGFDLACSWAREGSDLDELAEDLGTRTAEMHAALRAALPDAVATEPVTAVVDRLRTRASAALASSPALTGLGPAVHALLDDLTARALSTAAGSPAVLDVHRVHGDYHLGQVLRSVSRGWLVLDFEGEPSAPLAERTRADLPLRDVAGMLRSIDYAAAVGGAEDPRWAVRARAALLRGYAAAGGDPDPTADGLLLRALELDKALYEVGYEERHRPQWVEVPLAAVRRLLAG